MLSRREREIFTHIQNGNLGKFKDMYHPVGGFNKFISNSNGRSLLGVAIENRAYDIIDYLIKDPELINFKDKSERTPVAYGALSGDLDLLKKLHKAGANFKEIFSNGTNASHLAAIPKHNGEDAQSFKFVAVCGADPHHQSDNGETSYDVALRYRNMKIASLFKQHKGHVPEESLKP